MRNKDFDKLLKEAIILDAEEQGARLEPCTEPIPEAAQARFDAALNGNRKEPKRTASDTPSEQPKPVKRAHRWLAYGLTAVSAAAVVLVVALLIGTGGLRGTKPQEPVMPAEQQPMQAETTMEPLPEPGEPEQEPEPVEIRAEDLEGVWREWTPDNVDVGYRLTLFRDGTAKMVYQIPLSGEQTIEGTYSIENGGIIVTFGDETMQAVYDPESDALLLFESETSWLTLYRNPDTYMIEHWFEMQRKPLSKKTVAMEDLSGVWTLERAESAFSSFDLSGLSGYLSIEQGSFRIGMRLAGEDHSASLACSVIDSVLTETGTYYGVRAIVDPDTGLLKLSLVFSDRELTAADLVLVFRKLSESGVPEEVKPVDALIGTWKLKAWESEDKSQSGQIAIINAMIAAGKYEATYTFLSDGNGIAYMDIQGEKSAQAFTYVIDGNELIFSGETMIFAVDGDRLTLTEAGLTMLLDRTDSSTSEGTERSELQLITQTWQGYTCLFPETFEIQTVMDQKLSATEKALLQYDVEALQTVGLTDMDYYLVAESVLNGKDLLARYLAADGWDDKPEDFDIAETNEIVPGIESVHYCNRNYDSYICIAKLNSIGMNILFIAASSLTKEGTADFDSIVKQFVMLNGDFTSSDTGILNGKYGNSKVFTGDGYQITLTEQFAEQKSEMGFDGYYTAYFGAVMIKIEPFALKKGLENQTVAEYIADVIQNNGTGVQPEERDGLVFYRYKRDGMCGWNFAFKGEKAFYLVQFLCREADETELEELFFSIAKTIKVEGSDRWNL